MSRIASTINQPLVIISAMLVFSIITSGCLKNTDEVVDPDYDLKILDVKTSNENLYNESVTNSSYHYLVLEIEIENKNSDYELVLGASRFLISSNVENEYNYSSEIGGFVTINPQDTYIFQIDFMIPVNERGMKLIINLSMSGKDPKVVDIPLY